jgi:outer membrane protein insertion porin family
VKKKILRRYVPVFEENTVYTDLLVEGKRNLQDYFQSQGYYDVVVDFQASEVENDLQTIEYSIQLGERYKLKHLEITGNRYFPEDEIRSRMFIAPAGRLTLRRGRYGEAFRAKDEENIANLYRSNGFHDVKVTTSVDRSYKGKEDEVGVTVNVDEGPQWLVDKVTLTGVEQLSRDALIGRLTSIEGQPFAEANLTRDRNTVLTQYFAAGFPSATMRADWKPSGTPNHVDVTFAVEEGRRQFVRDVLITGLSTTQNSVVTKRMTLQAGDPLSPVEQTDIQKRFYDMGVFSRVDTAIQNPEGDTDHKYVLYNFEEANRYNVAVGLGGQAGRFGTPSSTSLSSPGGQNGFSPDVSLDVSRLNFRGMGHTVSLRGHYSNIERRASISYLQPRFQSVEGRNVTYSLLYENTLNVRTFSSKRQEASVQVSQQFTRSLNGLFRASYRKVSVSNVIIPVLLVPQLVQPVRLGMISATFSQDRRDNSSDPHRGTFNTLDLGLSTKYFGSQRSFGRILGRNASYYRIGRTVVLARQTQFGLIKPFAAPADISAEQSVPLPERFFGGGADSLRAFSFNQAGPRDTGSALVRGGTVSQPTGFPLGGNALLFNNTELRFPFVGQNIQGVLFHDMGNVFSSLGDISFRYKQRDLNDFNYLVHAVGFGIRYKTPVGPVRVDLSYVTNPTEYLGFGGTPQELLTCNPNAAPGSLPGYCTSTRQNSGRVQFFFSIGQTF